MDLAEFVSDYLACGDGDDRVVTNLEIAQAFAEREWEELDGPAFYTKFEEELPRLVENISYYRGE